MDSTKFPINYVYITAEEYRELIVENCEIKHNVEDLRRQLEETFVPVAEHKSFCEYFADRPWHREYYEAWLEAKNSNPAPVKPSKDCLTAMAEVKMHDCPKAVDAD